MKKYLSLFSARHAAGLLLGLALALPGQPAAAKTVTDVSGRSVVVPEHVERILLGEGRLIYAIAMLEGKQALARIAGWQGDFRSLDTQGYAMFKQSFAGIDDIPVVGASAPETFSVEQALAVKPDVAFLTLTGGHGPGPGSEAVKQLEAAGVPVVFVDFSAHPLRHTVPSVRVMADVLGRPERAQAFADFYTQQLQRVTQPLAIAAAQPGFRRPTIFIDMLAGLLDCCNSPGKGNLGEMVALAGGDNIGADRLPGPTGKLNLEYILARDPDVYVATGVFAAGQGGVTLGYQATAQEAVDSLRAVANRPETRELSAVRQGRAYGLWHIFYDSAEHFIAVQALAKWLHPELFADLDPERTRIAFYQRFMPIDISGVLFTGPLQ